MNELYEPQPCYPEVPKTMEQVIAEFFEVKPEDRQAYFRGYRPNFYFKQVSPYRSDTVHEWEINNT